MALQAVDIAHLTACQSRMKVRGREEVSTEWKEDKPGQARGNSNIA